MSERDMKDGSQAYWSVERTIGNTPLVRLQRLPGADNARRGNVILGKLEGNNPGGSVKDRPAYSMITRAESWPARFEFQRRCRTASIGDHLPAFLLRMSRRADATCGASWR